MNLREALEVLGPDRVRKGMRAIDGYYPKRGDSCEHCFVGEAFGGTYSAYGEGIFNEDPKVATAAERMETAYMNADLPWDKEATTRKLGVLRAECVAFLAEHGDAVEPSPASHGEASVASHVVLAG